MKQREKEGAFFKVPIDDTYHTYGRVLNDYKTAFYDFRTQSNDVDLDKIEQSPILFKLLVHKSAITKGFWPIVGHRELPESLKVPVPLFVQQIGNPKICHIHINGIQTQVKPEECVGIERFASWEYYHVEKRLADYYNGVPNQAVEHFKVKL